MRYRILFLCGFLCLARAASALYSAGADEPELIDSGLFLNPNYPLGLKVGYVGSYVFDRKMRGAGGVHGRVDTFEILSNQGVLTLNFMNRLEGSVSLGSMKSCFAFRRRRDSKRREFQTCEQFTWGAGARGLLFSREGAHIGVSGGYQYADLPIEWNTLDGASRKVEAKMRFWEWQVALLASYRVEGFSPYIGIDYSCAEAVVKGVRKRMRSEHQEFTMKSRDRVGMVLGCALTPSTIVDVGLEVQLFDEEAVSLAGNMRF